MLKDYYYENIGDYANQEFSLWYLDNKYAKLLRVYKNNFGILELEKGRLISCLFVGDGI